MTLKPLKIAFDASATPEHLVGAGYYVKEIVKLLDLNEEIELHLITRKEDAERFKKFAPNSKIHNVAPNHIATRMSYQAYRLGVFVDSLGVDVFHGPHYQLPFKMKTKSVVTIHDTTMLTHKDMHHLKKALYFSKMIPFVVKKANAIITVSNSSAKDVKYIFDIKDNVFVAQLGFDKKRFFPYESKTDKRRNIDIDLLFNRGISGNYIGFLGLLEPRKSIPTLIEAFTNIAKDFSDVKLIIAGAQGWGVEDIRELVVKSGIASRIIFPGRLSDIEAGAFMRQSQVFVYPSLYEGFGLPVLESMACGTPTITTDTSSLKEVAGSGVSAGALLIKPGDEKKLSIYLKQLLGDEKSRIDYSKKAVKRASSFSWEKCVQVHIDAYKSAIS